MPRSLAFVLALALCGTAVAQGLGNQWLVQLAPLTNGHSARSSLNQLIQVLPAGERRNVLAIELNNLATAAQKPGTEQFADSAMRAKSAVVAARAASMAPSAQVVLNALAATVRATEKAYYTKELRRNYPPDTYKLIFDRSRSAAALVDRTSGAPFCSASFLTSSVVLTAGHCLRDRSVSDIEVWRDYVQRADGSMSAPIRIQVDGPLYAPADPRLDFVLLRTKPVQQEDGDSIQPLCLSTDRVRVRELLYILGHPQQRPLTVHDFAEVLFPFEVTRSELDQLLTDQRASDAETHTLDSMQQSYQPTPVGTFVNNSRIWGERPTIGVLADTFQGNSGAAVFSRNSHRVVGVFVQGQPDYQDAWEPSWLRHEAVLPAASIIEDLRKYSNLIEVEKVCIL